MERWEIWAGRVLVKTLTVNYFILFWLIKGKDCPMTCSNPKKYLELYIERNSIASFKRRIKNDLLHLSILARNFVAGILKLPFCWLRDISLLSRNPQGKPRAGPLTFLTHGPVRGKASNSTFRIHISAILAWSFFQSHINDIDLLKSQSRPCRHSN